MRGVASVIRARGIDKRTLGIVDESVRLPRSLALLTAFRGSEGPSAPEAGQRPVSQTRPQSHVADSQARHQQCAWGPPSHIRDVLGVRVARGYGDPQSLAQLVHRARHKRSFAASRCLAASTRGARPIDTPPPSGCASHPLPDREGASSRCRALSKTHRYSPEVDRI